MFLMMHAKVFMYINHCFCPLVVVKEVCLELKMKGFQLSTNTNVCSKGKHTCKLLLQT